MATTVKEKGSGSSSSGTDKIKKTASQNKKTPTKSSPLSSSSSSDQKPQKPIPNYLKPTISSSHISTKPTATTTTIPSAATKRSHPIEKPPLPAQAHKAQPPKPNAPQRSVSSLSSKTTKTGAAPTMRRSISAKGSSSSSKKVATKTGHKGVTQPESRMDDHDVARGKDPLDNVAGGEVAQSDEQQAAQSDHATVTIEQGDEKTLEEAQAEVDQEDDKNEKEASELVEDHVDEEKVVEAKDEKVELSVEACKEGNKEEDEARKQADSGKEAQDYNDVIEETATKLMEDNTNKVRALAGAFETVISLQDTK